MERTQILANDFVNQQDPKAQKFVQVHKNILNEMGFTITPDSKVLDFGCGAGKEVYQFRKLGYKAYGCDIKNLFDDMQKRCEKEKLISAGESIFGTIDMSDYRIPFPDETFDYVFSNQVFEHVQNYPEALSEIHRVLKPGGCSLHFFPARYRPIEPHVFVPFAGVFRSFGYLLFWAFFGIRNPFQKGHNFKKVARANREYLTTRTTYFTKAKIREKVFNQFKNVSFVEKYFIKYGGGRLRSLTNLPFIPSLIRSFHTRAIFFTKIPVILAMMS
jgi:ubiquinone/menaquinone biosynthesis C-methylase UbiE